MQLIWDGWQIQIVVIAIFLVVFEAHMIIFYSLSKWRFSCSLSGHIGCVNHVHY